MRIFLPSVVCIACLGLLAVMVPKYQAGPSTRLFTGQQRTYGETGVKSVQLVDLPTADAANAKPEGLLAMLDEPLVEVQLQPEKKKPAPPKAPAKPEPVKEPPKPPQGDANQTCGAGGSCSTVSGGESEEGGRGRIKAILARLRHPFHRGEESGRGRLRGCRRGGCG